MPGTCGHTHIPYPDRQGQSVQQLSGMCNKEGNGKEKRQKQMGLYQNKKIEGDSRSYVAKATEDKGQ